MSKALGDRKGITRYGHAYAPMDEPLSRVALDISGRPFTVWKAEFSQKRLGDFDTDLFDNWFKSFAQEAGITLHVETLHGRTNHHTTDQLHKEHAPDQANRG